MLIMAELLPGPAADQDERAAGGDRADLSRGGGGQRGAEHLPRIRQEGQGARSRTHRYVGKAFDPVGDHP